MITVATVFVWWLCGFCTFAFLRRDDCMTWGEAVVIGGVMFGILGPLIAVAIAVFMISALSFWQTPVCDTFKRKRGDD